MNGNDNYKQTFRAEDGMIKVRYDHYDSLDEPLGYLYFKQPFSKFHLYLEYQFAGKLQSGAHYSGVIFHAQDPYILDGNQDWPVAVEMQFLASLDDGQPRPTGNMCSPGTEVRFNGKQYESDCLNSSSPTYSANEWVTAELVVWEDSLITHIINKDTVLQYSKPTVSNDVVPRCYSAILYPGAALKSGYIALQSEGQPINFRNIRIRELR